MTTGLLCALSLLAGAIAWEGLRPQKKREALCPDEYERLQRLLERE